MKEINYQLEDTLQKGVFIMDQESDNTFGPKYYDTLFITNGTNTTLKDKIITAIRDAESVVKLCSFIVTDQEIVGEILNKIKDSNIAVFLLTQLDKKKLTNQFAISSNIYDEEDFSASQIDSHLANIKMLRDNGVHVRAAIDLHAKFVISDRKNGLIMSANFTTNSLYKNVESGVLMDNDSSRDLDTLFDLIYLHGTSYKSFTNTKKSKKMFVVENNATLLADQLPLPSNGLRYTYDNLQNNLLEEINRIIDDAEDYIFLSTYSIVGLAKIPQFVNAISKACSKGVKISIFCRAMNNRFDHLEGCRILSNLGCKLFGDYYNHSKGIVTEKKAMIFTANIDGNYGLLNSFEIGYIINESQRRDFLDFHKELINNSIFRFSERPTRKDFMNFVAHYEIEKDHKPFFSEIDIEIVVKKPLHHHFENVSDNLMFIGRKNENNQVVYFLSLDDNFFIVSKSMNKLTVLKKCSPFYNTERYFLKFFKLKITFTNE